TSYGKTPVSILQERVDQLFPCQKMVVKPGQHQSLSIQTLLMYRLFYQQFPLQMMVQWLSLFYSCQPKFVSLCSSIFEDLVSFSESLLASYFTTSTGNVFKTAVISSSVIPRSSTKCCVITSLTLSVKNSAW